MTDLISLYVQYQSLRSSTSPMFGKHLIIQTTGHSLGRNSYCMIQPRSVHFNTLLCLIGPSGKSMKSTAQNDIMAPIIPYKNKGPSSFSPTGLLRALEEQSQLLCPAGEFSTVLRGIKNGGYMAEFKEISNDLFTCPRNYMKRLTNRENSYEVVEPYLSISSTVTEEEFFPYLTPDMVHGGFLPRWVLVYDKPKKKCRDDLPLCVDVVEQMFQQLFIKMYAFFEKNPIKFKLTNDAKDVYNNICVQLEESKEYEEVQPFVVRYENYIIAYACMLHVSDIIGKLLEKKYEITEITNITDITKITEITNKIEKSEGFAGMVVTTVIPIDSNYIKKAWEILKPSLDYAKEIMSYVDEDFYVAKITRHLKNVDDKIKRNDLLIKSKLLKNQFDKAIEVIILRKEFEYETITKGEGQHKSVTVWVKKVK